MNRRFQLSVVLVAAVVSSSCQANLPNYSSPAAAVVKDAAVPFSVRLPAGASSSTRSTPHLHHPTTAPDAQSATVSVVSHATGRANSPSVTVGCAATCHGSIEAPIGIDDFTVQLFSETAGAGTLLSTGSVTATIDRGQGNTLNVSFDPVVSSVAVSVNPMVLPSNTAGQQAQVSVTAFDSSGISIVGLLGKTFFDAEGNAVALRLTSTSPNLSFSPTSITGPRSTATVTLTSPMTSIEFPIISVTGDSLPASSIVGAQLGVPISGVNQLSLDPLGLAPGKVGTGYDIVAMAQGSSGPYLTDLDTNSNLGLTQPAGGNLPQPCGLETGLPLCLTAGSDANLWFYDASNNAIARVAPSLSSQPSYPAGLQSLPAQPDGPGYDCCYLGSDGNIWFDDGVSTIGNISPSGTQNFIPVPTSTDGFFSIVLSPTSVWIPQYTSQAEFDGNANVSSIQSVSMTGGGISTIATYDPPLGAFTSNVVSPVDGDLYASVICPRGNCQASAAILRIARNGIVDTLCQVPFAGSSVAILADGSLLFVGQGSKPNPVASATRVVAGGGCLTEALAVEELPAVLTVPSGATYIFGIVPGPAKVQELPPEPIGV